MESVLTGTYSVGGEGTAAGDWASAAAARSPRRDKPAIDGIQPKSTYRADALRETDDAPPFTPTVLSVMFYLD